MGKAAFGGLDGFALRVDESGGDRRWAGIAIVQTGAETKLYHNDRARPGLRVRLQGRDGNPEGIGAVLRLKFNGGMGPAREVHAGSGYWSQDSAVQVLGTPEPPVEIWVRWPGGKATTGVVPAGAKEILVTQTGQILLKK